VESVEAAADLFSDEASDSNPVTPAAVAKLNVKKQQQRKSCQIKVCCENYQHRKK